MLYKLIILILGIAIPFSGILANSYCARNFLPKDYFDYYAGKVDPILATGVEVEGIIPAGHSFENIVASLKRSLAKKRGVKNVSVIEHEGTHYSIAGQNSDGSSFRIEIKNDISIKPASQHFQGIEIASQILRTDEDVDNFYYVLRELKNYGMKSEVNTAGVHIHIGGDVNDAHSALLLTLLFDKSYHKLFDFFDLSIERKVFNRSLKKIELAKLSKALKQYKNSSKMDEAFTDLVGVFDRKKVFNLAALEKFGTLEVRVFGSTLSRRRIELYRNFSQTLTKAALTKDPRLINYLERTPLKNIDLIELANELGVKGLRKDRWWRKIEKTLADSINYYTGDTFAVSGENVVDVGLKLVGIAAVGVSIHYLLQVYEEALIE